ncbi:MFS transporter [Brevibacterium sp. UCMA 11754]|uniref:MFS transporter n=1 Tax=Brevibacterium sp. UCMA 11754 TaxID=2749198 RepID=UPI001F378095|nr:MFS transporter [Brevibacterium sp. UCMA 11754]MCF2572867.1 MFS transporter [Brevibacterium sp. UCMA 11754]
MNSQTAATKQRRAASPGRARWWILGWLLAAMMINYMDRSSLSIAAPHMIDELGLTAADIGLLGTAFSLTYAFFQLPGGWLTDRLGAKPVYVIALGFWSIATSLMAFGHHMWHFMISRVLLGVFEAPVSPTSAKIVSEWFPPRERGAAVGVYDSGSKWGPAVAPPILTFLIIGFGWRAMFVILGVLGIIVAVGFWVFYRSPEHDRRVSAAELEHIRAREEDNNAPTGNIPWLRLFTKPQTWAMVLGFVAVVWTLNIFVTFLPLMLGDIYSVADEALGWYTAIPFAVGGIGGILGGWFTTKYSRMRSHLTPLACKRRIAAIYGGALAICSILVGVTTGHFALQLTAMSLALFFCGALSAVGWSIPADVVTGSRVASLGSIQNFGGYFAGSLSPWLTGVLVTTTGSYLIPFVLGAVVAVIAGIAYLLLLRAPIRVDSSTPEIGDTRS